MLFEGKLVLATRNTGKIRDYMSLLRHENIKVLSILDGIDFPEVEETGSTYEENAKLKALSAAQHTHIPALGDDSGLELSALNGYPGVRTVDETGRDYQKFYNEKLKPLLTGDDLGMALRCTLVLAYPDEQTWTFTSVLRGTLSPEWLSGDQGFGLEPAFIPVGYPTSMSRLDTKTRERISPRTQVFQKLISFLNNPEKAYGTC